MSAAPLTCVQKVLHHMHTLLGRSEGMQPGFIHESLLELPLSPTCADMRLRAYYGSICSFQPLKLIHLNPHV